MEASGRPRTPGLVYTALAVALVVIVAIVALTARQTPPPTIAEFAPQAQQQIQDLQDFFNLRYEFYGRHINFIVSTNGAGATGSSGVAQQQAEADVAVQDDSFASNFYRAAGGFAYTDALARRHVVNVTGMLIP